MGPRQLRWCSVALLCISTGGLIRTVGCPLVGNLTEGEMSPEPKGPTQAQSSSPEVDGHRRRRALLGPHNHEDNLFHSPEWRIYNVLIPLRGAPNGTYWLCAMRTVSNNDKNLKALFREYKPHVMRRDKRSLADITHTQAPASRFF
ncbi:unnamed protein product, partial [Coregonus sp. 'balchen']